MRGNITPNGWGSLDIWLGRRRKSPKWVQFLLIAVVLLFIILCMAAPSDPVLQMLGH